MSASLNELLARYGYLFIAVFLFIESIGVPIPGETALVTAAALAGGGKLSIVGVVLAAIFGTVTGGMTGYWMGARGGQAIVLRFGRLLRLDQKRLDSASNFFEQHGASALVVGRFVAVVRSFLGIFAGVSAMPRRKFAIYNAIGACVWSLTFSAVGFVFGKNLPTLMRDLGRLSLVVALVVGLVILLVVAWRWFSANGPRLIGQMERRWARLDARPWVVALRERHPTVWRWLIFQFVRGEYLFVHLLIGWTISVATLGIFGAITEDVVEGAPLTRSDVVLSAFLSGLGGSNARALLGVIGSVGGPRTIGVIVAVAALYFLIRRNWLTLGGWIGAYAGSVALDIVLRRIVHRAELPHLPDLVTADLARLPTGHTVGTIAIFGMIVHFLLGRARSAWSRVLIVVLAVALVGGIVTARLFLGTSYLSTESASIAAGVIWLATCISGLEFAKHRRADAT